MDSTRKKIVHIIGEAWERRKRGIKITPLISISIDVFGRERLVQLLTET